MQDKPCTEPRLVLAGQGSSALNTVQYKDRFLYSKYSPDAAIKKTIQNLNILPQSIVLVFSPCLWYGINELLQKCGTDSLVVAFEADRVLYEFSKQQAPVEFFCKEQLLDLDALIRKLTLTGKFRRVLTLDMSAGTQFEEELYSKVALSCEEIVASFWKSRLTLNKLGRLYSKNVFKNLKFIEGNRVLSEVAHTVSKPILVCGAGESLDKTLSQLKPVRNDFFILCVDAALPCLKDALITPDAAVGMESQFAIQKAYIGFKGNEFPIFLDITSRNQIARMFDKNIIWFLSEYAQCSFLTKIKESFFATSWLPPLGSVGLSAVAIALTLRKNDETPVYVTGLDFAFSSGRTHASSAPHQKERLFYSTRIKPSTDYSAFSKSNTKVPSKSQKAMYSTPAMNLYAKMFGENFGGKKNLFDASECGQSLGIQSKSITQKHSYEAACTCACGEGLPTIAKTKNTKIDEFYRNENLALKKIKDLLTNGEKSSYRERDKTLSEQLECLLLPREYLYLHFPDGYALSVESSFLKRVRAELDVFIRLTEPKF